MKIQFIQEHCQHIVIDDFMPGDQLNAFNEDFKLMHGYSTSGKLYKDNSYVVDKDFKSRVEFDIYKESEAHGLGLADIWKENFWNDNMAEVLYQAGGIFSYAPIATKDALIGAFYSAQDFYKPHADLFNVTAIFLHQDENNFEGGDFYLGNRVLVDDPKLKFLKLDYVKNRLVVFPSRFIHYAGIITKTKLPGVDGMRLCTQNFIDFKSLDI